MEVGTRHQLIVGIKIHAVGSFGAFQPEGDSLVFVPQMNTVVRLVGKEYLPFGIHRGAFGEGVTGADAFNSRVIRDDTGVLSPEDRRSKTKEHCVDRFHIVTFVRGLMVCSQPPLSQRK